MPGSKYSGEEHAVKPPAPELGSYPKGTFAHVPQPKSEYSPASQLLAPVFVHFFPFGHEVQVPPRRYSPVAHASYVIDVVVALGTA